MTKISDTVIALLSQKNVSLQQLFEADPGYLPDGSAGMHVFPGDHESSFHQNNLYKAH